MRLADVSIRRPVFAVMLVGSFVILGIVSIPRLGIDLWPRVELPMLVVTTVLEGAAPETVEREVSQVLEESINTIDGIETRDLYPQRVGDHLDLLEARDRVQVGRTVPPGAAQQPVIALPNRLAHESGRTWPRRRAISSSRASISSASRSTS